MLIGLVGKPSAGKSTFFKAATLADIDIASYPFTTIAPNKGVGHVRVECADKDFDKQCDPKFGFCEDGTRFVPVQLTDVAGLVPGAHEGKGMGNQFLSDLNEADVLIHVVDCSGTTDAEGEPTEGHDPADDIRFLEEELDMWYLNVLKRGWEKASRTAGHSDTKAEKVLAEQMSAFRVDEDMARNVLRDEGLEEKALPSWSGDEMHRVAVELRKLTKPILIACNKMDLPESHENYERLKEEFPDYTLVPCVGDAELALREADRKNLIDYLPGDNSFEIKGDVNEKQRTALERIDELLTELGSTGVQEALDAAVFDLLGYIAVFPGGANKLEDSEGRTLPDCFLMPEGSTALDFAYELHSDFGDSFLHGINVRDGRRIGKDYELKHRDVIEVVTAAK